MLRAWLTILFGAASMLLGWWCYVPTRAHMIGLDSKNWLPLVIVGVLATLIGGAAKAGIEYSRERH